MMWAIQFTYSRTSGIKCHSHEIRGLVEIVKNDTQGQDRKW